MTEPPRPSFANTLKRFRLRENLTQEELAEAAKMSPRAISDLERGVNLKPQKRNASLLASALQLEGVELTEFEKAARGHDVLARLERTIRSPDADASSHLPFVGASPGSIEATNTLPRDNRHFTGRKTELERLTDAVTAARNKGSIIGIHAIDGMAGIGKTTFAIHAANKLMPQFPHGQIFLSMNGHTPGQQPVEPLDALGSLLEIAGIPASLIPSALAARARLWQDHLSDKQMILVFDDAIGHDQIEDLLPANANCLVLVTSRQRLVALNDCQVISLETMQSADANGLFATLADRRDVAADDPTVGLITDLCGYLPLAIGMLARQLHHHRTWTSEELVEELRSHRLPPMHAENMSVARAFDLSYQKLTLIEQETFKRLGLSPGADIDALAVAAMGGTDVEAAKYTLDSLYDKHLIGEPTRGRFRLHDLVREYARSLAAEYPAEERDAAVLRLLYYYAYTARGADRMLPSRTPSVSYAMEIAEPKSRPNLGNSGDAIRWIDSERFNLHAAASHAVASGRGGHAIAIAAAMHGFLTTKGHYHLARELHELALTAAIAQDDDLAAAGALLDRGDAEHLLGEFSKSIASLELAQDLYKRCGHLSGQAGALTLLGDVHQGLGHFSEARENLRQSLSLYGGTDDALGKGRALGLMGYLQQATGNYSGAMVSLNRALKIHRGLGNRLREAVTFSYIGQVLCLTGRYEEARSTLTRAFELHVDQNHVLGQANVLSILGALHLAMKNYPAAIDTLTQARQDHQDLKHPLGEATTLDHLGKVQYLIGNHDDASSNLTRALALHRGLNNRIGESEVLNTLGEVSLGMRVLDRAVACHNQALAIATNIGSPLQQARALEGLGKCLLFGNMVYPGRQLLGRALRLYRSIGSPSEHGVATYLRQQLDRD